MASEHIEPLYMAEIERLTDALIAAHDEVHEARLELAALRLELLARDELIEKIRDLHRRAHEDEI